MCMRIGVALLTLSFVSASGAEEFKANCPVSGGPAKESSSTKYKGKNLYFCCNNCPKAYAKNPEKFATKANYQLLQTNQIVQVACPFSGNEINAETETAVGTTKVSFCCNNCKGKVEKADDAIALVFKDISKGFTLQTACPVSGKAIDVSKTAEHDGKTVYFCCPNCPKAFSANPEKFTKKLPQFKAEDEG